MRVGDLIQIDKNCYPNREYATIWRQWQKKEDNVYIVVEKVRSFDSYVRDKIGWNWKLIDQDGVVSFIGQDLTWLFKVIT